MKKLLVLLFSILISFNSYGEWKEVAESNTGNIYYLDYSSIKENNGYVYWWYLNDYIEPTEYGDLSSKNYIKTNCKNGSMIYLSSIFYTQSMGTGSHTTETSSKEYYFPPDSVLGFVMKQVCEYVE